MSAVKKRKRAKFVLPPPMTDDELRHFVAGYCDGRITVSADMPENLIGMVFLPITFGACNGATKAQLKKLGCIWAERGVDKDCERGINGFPIFVSCRIMLKTDWDRARKAILIERERRGAIEIPK